MPGIDGTGPEGKGPMTGRGFGRCRCGPAFHGAVTPPEQAQETGEGKEPQAGQPCGTGSRTPGYGAGRGSSPGGCGRGRCFGACGGGRWREKPGEGA